MSVDYNNFAKTFSNSRKNMKWEEIDYFLSSSHLASHKGRGISILDIWCGNWRFLSHLKENKIEYSDYLWVDLSQWLLEDANYMHPESRFLHLNMIDLDNLKDKFDNIFFIASFHHLNNIEDRLVVLKKAKNLLNENWKIFMTNWSLNSELNKDKYNKSIINWTKNKFWSLDYSIKIWEFDRYYHCFDLMELEYLFAETWFEIIENKEFENQRNFVSVIRKE